MQISLYVRESLPHQSTLACFVFSSLVLHIPSSSCLFSNDYEKRLEEKESEREREREREKKKKVLEKALPLHNPFPCEELIA